MSAKVLVEGGALEKSLFVVIALEASNKPRILSAGCHAPSLPSRTRSRPNNAPVRAISNKASSGIGPSNAPKSVWTYQWFDEADITLRNATRCVSSTRFGGSRQRGEEAYSSFARMSHRPVSGPLTLGKGIDRVSPDDRRKCFGWSRR